jgi:ADP-ribose pyrophosphatase
MSTIVIYKTKYGSTKQYAEWIAEELSADLKNADTVKPEDLTPYDTIIFGAGVYIGCISGIGLIQDNFEQFKGKNIILFTVGLTDPKNKGKYSELVSKNIPENMMDAIKIFHLRGALDYKKIGLGNRLMMKRMKIPEDNFVDKESIRPIIEAARSPGPQKKTLKTTTIYENHRFKIETKPVHLPNGNDREYLFIQPVPAVCILPMDETSVYLIKQYRAVIDQYILEVPAGGMDQAGEDPLDCAKRELAEEARFSANEYIPRGYVYSSPGFCTEKLWLFEARGLTPCEDFARDEDEIIEVVKIQKTDIWKMIHNGEIVDGKTLSILAKCLGET